MSSRYLTSQNGYKVCFVKCHDRECECPPSGVGFLVEENGVDKFWLFLNDENGSAA